MWADIGQGRRQAPHTPLRQPKCEVALVDPEPQAHEPAPARHERAQVGLTPEYPAGAFVEGRMKLTRLSLPFLIIFAFVACSDEDGPSDDDAGIVVGPSANIADADDSACHDGATNVAMVGVAASCVGPTIPTVDDADVYCEDKPFGTFVWTEDPVTGEQLNYCTTGRGAGGSEWFIFGENYRHVIAVATSNGETSTVDVFGLNATAATHDFRCGSRQEIDNTRPVPVGEVSCGAMTVVQADGSGPPIVRVMVDGEAVDLTMTTL